MVPISRPASELAPPRGSVKNSTYLPVEQLRKQSCGNGMHFAKEMSEMKKVFATVICLLALIVATMPVGAQTRYRSNRRSVQTARQYDRTANVGARSTNDLYDDRSVWEKHRDKITTAGGAAAGAIFGGLLGGKKGAIIGAVTGGGGAAIYTYKVRDKGREY